ncbi:MAG: hypothetical protein ACRDCE_16640 [Cetobacterium sp.]|uniref:hypothetical protein n=1 Tax=Cetobacterium sp. TaxID=2071632 RepID=UPI003EE5E4C0
MKKITMILFLGLLVACGKNEEIVQLTKRSEKIKKIEKVLSGDKKTKLEIEKIREKLESQMKNGKSEAKEELEEWEKIEKSKNRMGNLRSEDVPKL